MSLLSASLKSYCLVYKSDMFSKENLTVQKKSGKKKLKNHQYFQEPERITPNLVGCPGVPILALRREQQFILFYGLE